MLKITIPSIEAYDEERNLFISIKGCTLSLEHSLVSISKWESKFHKPFLVVDNKTDEEVIEYIKCMTLTQNVDPEVYNFLPKKSVDAITNYIGDPMTATTFKEEQPKRNNEIMTSELIYYLMTAYQIPFECQKWHLNRLLTLIRICGIKNNPQKKMSKGEILRQNASLNAARRAAMHSKG